MKKFIIISVLGCCPLAPSFASNYTYLVFETSSGTTASIDVTDLEITANGTSLEVINAQGTTLLTLSDLSKMYFSNSAEGTIIDADNLILNDGIAFTPSQSYSVSTASYTRDMTTQWGTICVPFELTSDEIVQFYTLSDITSTTMSFSPVSSVPAGQPAVLKISNTGSDASYQLTVSLENASISPDIVDCTPISGWTMKGTYEPVSDITEDADGSSVYFISNDAFWRALSNVSCAAYRGWFETTSSASNAAMRIAEGGTEALDVIEQEDGNISITYDMQGRRTNNDQGGFLIKDGKKIMVK